MQQTALQKKGQIGPDRLIGAKMGTQSNGWKVGAHCAQLHTCTCASIHCNADEHIYMCMCND